MIAEHPVVFVAVDLYGGTVNDIFGHFLFFLSMVDTSNFPRFPKWWFPESPMATPNVLICSHPAIFDGVFPKTIQRAWGTPICGKP